MSIRRHFAVAGSAWLLAVGGIGAARALEFSTVVIDAGHGGNDQGTSWAGVKESQLTLQVAERVEALLKKKGLKTEMTRRSDIFLPPDGRIEVANRQQESSIFVSIHFNSSSSWIFRGVESFYGGPASMPLAREIQNRMAKELNTDNRGIKRRLDLRVLRLTKGPAVLLECGFLSHPVERVRSQSTAYQQTLAQAICDGIMAVHDEPRAKPMEWLDRDWPSWTDYTLLGWVRHGLNQLLRDRRP
ncbi:N-acetylmuramoyl-L-alanine amidase [Haloferula sp. BvORR071]|uniref:N-acetylmuramoyl-L-alanine amidase n=1 Tax=Haloferula sp. BvORR071 TaxID=1396141 RepID=UPI002240F069|nr:N-acetylmuramoyl-L-alanine amidase [Haloferula sp. BvORR071]